MRKLTVIQANHPDAKIQVTFLVNGLTETPPIGDLILSHSEWNSIKYLLPKPKIDFSNEEDWLDAATALKPLFIQKLQGY